MVIHVDLIVGQDGKMKLILFMVVPCHQILTQHWEQLFSPSIVGNPHILYRLFNKEWENRETKKLTNSENGYLGMHTKFPTSCNPITLDTIKFNMIIISEMDFHFQLPEQPCLKYRPSRPKYRPISHFLPAADMK